MALIHAKVLRQFYLEREKLGSGALSGKILLVRIVENDKIDAYFRVG